jgi:hypothetical protein
VAVIIWHMLRNDEAFNAAFMVERKLTGKAESMSRNALLAGQAGAQRAESSKPALQSTCATAAAEKKVETRETGVTGEKRKKAG